MRILLLGGTGAMGSHLTNILVDKGYNIVITSRSRNEMKELVEYRKGNAKDIDFLKEVLCEKFDVIVDFMIYKVNEFQERVNLLLESTVQYFFISSARVYDNSQQLITEKSSRLLDSSSDYEFLSTKEYALSKARQEDILFESDMENWTIVRPYITYSERRLQLGTLEKEDWLYRAMKGRSIVFSDDMRSHLTTLTYGLDVAYGIAGLINNRKAFREIYHITNEYACSWNNVLEIYLDVLEDKFGKRPKVIYQNLIQYQSWNSGKYRIIYDRLYDRMFDNTKINDFISTNDFLQVEKGLSKCLGEFLENPEFDRINWKKEAIKDRYANEITPLKEIKGIKSKIMYFAFRYIIRVNSKTHKLIERLIK